MSPLKHGELVVLMVVKSVCPFPTVDIDSEFKTYLQELVPLLLEPSRLIIKKINGNIVTGRGLVECFKVYSPPKPLCVCVCVL